MQQQFDEHVAIFWDYENCTPPTSAAGYDVVNNIRQVAHEYGSVKLFKAYLELSEQSSSKSLGLRSELQSCGVSLTDCPHNGRKDVADKMMIVDMLTYAIDNPAPATVVLISGDRDFVYAVSVLRLRKYRVVLVAPNCAHASLKSQASAMLDWETDIMCKTSLRAQQLEPSGTVNDVELQQPSPRRPPLSLGGPLQRSASKRGRRLSFRVTNPLTPVTPKELENGIELRSPQQGRHLHNPSIVTTDENALPGLTYQPEIGMELTDDVAGKPLLRLRNTLDGVEPCSPIEDIVEVMRGLDPKPQLNSSPSDRRCPELSSPAGSSASATLLSSIKRPESTSQPRAPLGTPSFSGHSTEPEIIEVRAPFHQLDDLAGAFPHTGNMKPCVTPPPVGFPQSDCQPPIKRVPTVESYSRSSSKLSSPAALSSATSEEFLSPPSEPDDRYPQFVLAHVEERVSSKWAGSTDHVTPAGPSSHGSSSVSDSLRAPNTPQPSGPNPILQPDGTRTSEVTGITTPASLTLAMVQPSFHPLMRVLEQLRLSGFDRPLRSMVGHRLRQVAQDMYEGTGKGAFKKHVLAAAEAGLVVVGGQDGYAWISLDPQWQGRMSTDTVPV